MKRLLISKSSFIRGLQCQKSLFLYKFHFKQKNPVSRERQASFNHGNNIGKIAQGLFPGGVDLGVNSAKALPQAVKQTQLIMKSGYKVLYEAAFHQDGMIAAVDIMVKGENGWKVYEVKSSTQIHNVHVWDAAYQFHLLKEDGIKIESFNLVNFILKEYQAELPLQKQFSITNLTSRLLELEPGVKEQLQRSRATLDESEIPEIPMGVQCQSPYPCEFTRFCERYG